MSTTEQRIEAFIADELQAMAPLFEERMAQQLQRRGITASNELLRSMASRAVGSKEIQMDFLLYGRFNDMGARPGWRKGVYIGTGTPGKKPKGTKFYSRTKMGLYGQLVSNLSNKYVDALYQQALTELTDEPGKN